MEIEPQSSSTKVSLKKQAESFLGVVGVALVIVYGLGFLILSLHDANFGILEFDPFRARIFQVGLLFVCLLVLPVAALHYGFTLYVGLGPIMQPAEPRLERRRKAILLSAFTYTAWIMAFYLGLFLVAPAPSAYPPWVSGVALLVALLFFFVSFSAIAKRFSENANHCVVLAVLSILFMGIVQDAFSKSLSALSAWFISVAVVAFFVRESEDLIRAALHWWNWFVALCLLALYASSVYVQIKPKYGGRAPIPIVFYLNRPLPWTNSKVASVSLLDEAGQGYYVTARGSDHAIFIPRPDVAAIYFGPSNEAPKIK